MAKKEADRKSCLKVCGREGVAGRNTWILKKPFCQHNLPN